MKEEQCDTNFSLKSKWKSSVDDVQNNFFTKLGKAAERENDSSLKLSLYFIRSGDYLYLLFFKNSFTEVSPKGETYVLDYFLVPVSSNRVTANKTHNRKLTYLALYCAQRIFAPKMSAKIRWHFITQFIWVSYGHPQRDHGAKRLFPLALFHTLSKGVCH